MTDPPIPVTIESPVPIPVEVVAGAAPHAPMQPGQVGGTAPSKPDVMTTSAGQLVAAPTTTEEEDRVSLGQRDTSKVWESTQRQIALCVIGAALIVAIVLAVFGKQLGTNELQLASAVFLYGVANLVTGFYFGRTNHTRVGGVAQKER